MRSNINVGFCPTPVGLCPRGHLSYGLLSYGRLFYGPLSYTQHNHLLKITVALAWFWFCRVPWFLTIIFLRHAVTGVKISVLCVISAFERSLMYARKPCCGREIARCRCKIR